MVKDSILHKSIYYAKEWGVGLMPILLSILFFIAFGIYLFFGIYIIQQNIKADLNRIFLGICISLCFWSLGFAVANSAPDIETCLLWRRVSAIGWGSVYSFLLHYTLALVNKHGTGKKIKLWWPIYIPAIFSIYAFALSSQIISSQFNLIYTDYGWVNVAVKNKWTIFFNSYYIIYVLACLFLLLKMRRKTPDINVKKLANLIMVTTAISLLLGTLTDVVLTSFLSKPLPQMAPIFTLIPITATYYNIKKYDFMETEEGDKGDLILTHKTRRKLYYHLITAYIGGGLLSTLSYFLGHMIAVNEGLESNLFAGISLFTLGIVMLLIQLIKDEDIKSGLMLLIMIVSIPLILIRYVWYAGITVWVIPIILMTASLTFNTRTPLALITITSIITQLFIWKNSSSNIILFDEFDHLIRIGLFIITFWLGSFVNKTYTERLDENIYRAKFQKIVSEVSFSFVNINQSNMGQHINGVLEKVGRFFGVDQSYVCLIKSEDYSAESIYVWGEETGNSAADTLKELCMGGADWWANQLYNERLVSISDINELPNEAVRERTILRKNKVKSIMIISIMEKEELIGFIGLSTKGSAKNWTNYHGELLKILSNLLIDALVKVRSEKEIEYMAYYDILTGLPNRILFSDRLSQAIHLAKRNEKLLGVLFMDLDSFKVINDTMGHKAGDTLLKSVGHNLLATLRKTDTVARFGGDEFLILINNVNSREDIIKVADNIMKVFDDPFYIKEQRFFVTASAGISLYPTDGEDPETLIKNADIAMYEAKSKGKNQYALCTTKLKDETRRNMQISNSLYRVEESGQLEIHYQPQVNLATGQITGLEALLRWNHPVWGMIPPNVFIPLAEQNGTINNIGNWVLREAIRQNKQWQEKGLPHFRIAVNLSLIQFNNPHFADEIYQMLQEADLHPSYLELEVTESVATKETKYIMSALNSLKEKGISISIDDFGKEYSSLNRLKVLPIDRIKVDMQFVKGIDLNEKDRAITTVVINLAKSLGLQVLAEGVETESQLDFLNKKMCDEVQGYYFYRPMPVDKIENLFSNS